MTKEQKKAFSITGIAMLLLGGLIAWVVFTFTDFTAGRFVRPNTPAPSADEAAQRFAGRNDLTDPDYQNKVAAAGIAKGEREGYIPAGIPDLNNGGFTKPAPTPKPETKGPAPVSEAKAGNWTKTVATDRGPVVVEVVSSLGEKAKSSVGLSPERTIYLIIHNPSDTQRLKVKVLIMVGEEKIWDLGPRKGIRIDLPVQNGKITARLESAN